MSAFKKKNHNAFRDSGPSPSLSSMQGVLDKEWQKVTSEIVISVGRSIIN